MEGKGILYYKNNERYEGGFKKNLRHGLGKFFTEDGSILIG